MLAFARRQELETAPVDVAALVLGMADLVQRSIGPSVNIDTRFPLRLSRAFADGNQLELALLNLVVNARDAMPEGGTITIAAREEQIGEANKRGLAPGAYICLSVADTGEGMDEQALARAVEPFFTTKGVGKGTGLGLSMIHGFADQSGGRLVLESAKGRGTRAELWLPVATVQEDEAEEPDMAAAPRMPAASRTLTVLVVNDDSLVLMNTAAMLEDLGHTVIEATSGEQALRVLRRTQQLDLVITDQLMPGMTGAQLLAAIRTERPDLPAILATGYADIPAEEELAAVRLAKPFLQRDLARAIASSVRPGRGHVLAFRAK
ncbi:response regulator [Micromonospora sp. STR1s_5]|nr:response regulator [Micromonospora sp. STR1s_5]